jgi:diguanylate cyclase (GGDEF)-like protein
VTDSDRQRLRHFLLIEDTKGKRLVGLEAATHTLGRDRSNAIVIHSREVSRQHATLLRVSNPGQANFLFRVLDGNLQGKRSTNGLIVNGQRCLSYDLQGGDIIQFGGDAKARYCVTSTLTDTDIDTCRETGDYAQLYTPAAHDPFQTLLVPEDELDASNNEAAIARIASIPELSPNPIVEMDAAGAITYLNPAAIRRFPDLRSVGREHPILSSLIATAQSSKPEVFVREVAVGDDVFEQYVHYIFESDLIRSYIFDITERKRSEVEIQRRDSLLQGVAAATNHLLSIVTDADFDLAIAKVLETLGLSAGVDRIHICEHHQLQAAGDVLRTVRYEWTRSHIEPTQHQPHSYNQSYAANGLLDWYHAFTSGESIRGLTTEFSPQEQAALHRDGILSVLLAPIVINDHCWGYIGFHDCHSEHRWTKNEESILFTMAASLGSTIQRRRTEADLQYQALHSALTGLPNRLLFTDRLKRSLASVQQPDDIVAVLLLDLDRFGNINTTLGHHYGDQLLQDVADRLKQCIREREQDTLAHSGGDEFLFLLSQVESVKEIAKVAQRVLSAMKAPFLIENHELHLTASVGIATCPLDGRDAESLIKNADTALYRAKDNGRNNFQFYTPTMSVDASQAFVVEKHLYRALDRGEFTLHYQPQVSLNTCEIIGMEALLRWENPELGRLSPATFIPLMEENGLIIPIGEWVLQTTCAQNKAWQDSGLPPICVSVNLSVN